MRVPIPDDWDGEKWDCYQIAWPSSTLYRAILAGLLSQMTRGRFWDERTGIVRDAQEIGWMTFDKNMPQVSCAAPPPIPPPPPPTPIINIDGLSSDDIESLIGEYIEMAMITGAHWDKGVLYLDFGPCCSIPVKDISDCTTTAPNIKDMITNGEQSTMGTILDDLEPPSTGPNWACRKAYTLGKTFEDIVLAAVGAVNMVPWQAQNYLQSQVSYIHLDNQEAYQLYLAIQLIERTIPALSISNMWSTEQTEKLICELATQLDSTSPAMSADEFTAYYNEVWIQAGRGVAGDLMRTLAGSVGRSNMRLAIQSGVFYDGAVCDCPENTEIPIAHDWVVVLDWRLGDYGFESYQGSMANVVGVGWTRDFSDGAQISSAAEPFQTTGGSIVFTRHEFSSIPDARMWEYAISVVNGGARGIGDAFAPPQRTSLQDVFEPPQGFASGTVNIGWSFGQMQNMEGHSNSGTFTWTRTIIAGTGDNPFAGLVP